MTTHRIPYEQVGRRINWRAVGFQAAFVGLCVVGWWVGPMVAPEFCEEGLALRAFAALAFAAFLGFGLALAAFAIGGWFDATFPPVYERRDEESKR